MKVEIWSDVMCPFCYIGKRKFENALAQFPHKADVEVVWKSFQLNPDMKTDPNMSTVQYLADAKGWTLDHAKGMTNHVSNLAKQVGITFNMDKAVVANSFDAHRFLHFAQQKNVQNQAKERLLAAYFTEGANTADHEVLIRIGVEVGLNADELRAVLNSDQFGDEVKHDIYEAHQVGVHGVPFFVLGEKYAVSGAQESTVFLQALNQTWAEVGKMTVIEGETCAIDGDC
jgi:predicted DsbA family dithiol-disulfide isomerase